MRWVICHAADRRKLASVAQQQRGIASSSAATEVTAATPASLLPPRNVQHSYLYEEVGGEQRQCTILSAEAIVIRIERKVI